jgi:hypothetical protein
VTEIGIRTTSQLTARDEAERPFKGISREMLVETDLHIPNGQPKAAVGETHNQTVVSGI